ncbi:MAG TPA: carboxymuconolactone decarboxylase family protein [Candidatus Xenobia bacterium]|nr:carboxymuconolactone decarboxylase family protein [Candidatus Xenobia bacterium]
MPRIRPIPKDRSAVILRNLYDALEHRFGTTPNLFKTMAHRPELLLTFSNVHKELWTGGVLDPRTKALAALRTAGVNGCRYALALNAPFARSAGLSAEQMAALERDDWQSAGSFDEKDAAVLRLAEKLTRAPASVTDEDIADLKKWFGDAHLVELHILVGAENLLQRMALALQVEADPAG